MEAKNCICSPTVLSSLSSLLRVERFRTVRELGESSRGVLQTPLTIKQLEKSRESPQPNLEHKNH